MLTMSVGKTSDQPVASVTPPPAAYPHYLDIPLYPTPDPSPGNYYIHGLQQELNRLHHQIEQLHADRIQLTDELQQAYQHINQLNNQLAWMNENARHQVAAHRQLQHQLSVANAGYRNQWQRSEQLHQQSQNLSHQLAQLQQSKNPQPESPVIQQAQTRPGNRPVSQTQQTALATLADCISSVEPSEMRRCNPDQPMMIEGVSFEYDSHELTNESRQVLTQVADILKQQPDIKLEVAGHTDTQGHPAYNIWLSQLRAESVREFLIRHGMTATNLVAKGYGGEQPIADNNTWQGLHKNRRVELRWIN